jgi:hypothetical protein
MNKQVNQRCCEWMALANMAEILADKNGFLTVFEVEDLDGYSSALGKIRDGMPDGPVCGQSAMVVLSEEEIKPLVKLVDWYDDLLLSKSKMLTNLYPEAFTAKYEQMGLIKRNLKLYAKDLENTEPREGTA